MKTDFNSNYRIQGIEVLLEKDRILTGYHTLIPCQHQLVQNLLAPGCRTHDDCLCVSDELLYEAGLPHGPGRTVSSFPQDV